MEYTTLGKTGLKISRLCLGTAQFGSGRRPDEDWAFTIDDQETVTELIDRALELGINVLDTANSYSTGDSERMVGTAIEGRREEVVLSTKVGMAMADRPNGGGLSRKHVREQARASLDRLGTDYVDIYQLHCPDPETPIAETLAALNGLIQSGAVHYLGASNFPAWQLTRGIYENRLRGHAEFVCVEPKYNLLCRAEEYNSLPVAAAEGIGVLTYSPLASGFLADAYDRESLTESDRLAHRPNICERLDAERNWRVLNEVRAIAEEKGATPVQVSVAWLLETGVVDSVIVGPESVAELEEYAGALNLSLDDSEMTRLEAPVDPT
jgi:aryl-alcohol dehydrogenase-like predicted oxidoreductase